MAQMIFDEKTLFNDAIFKFEKRLHTPLDRYIDKGAILVKYFSQDENATTVDRGIQDIEALFGSNAPIRYNLIDDFPLYSFGPTTPEDGGDENIEDFNVEGDCVMLPATIVPKPWDFFIIKHLKQLAIFSVRSVSYDTMKPDGYYKIHYRLQSTSREVLQRLEGQVINKYNTELSAIGTSVNPIIKEDDFTLRGKIKRMVVEMMEAYKAVFYNSKHNCFLYHDQIYGMDLFDMCGNEFMAKYSLINPPNANDIVILHDKLYDKNFPLKYLSSPYHWLEIDAPIHLFRKFRYNLISSDKYPFSSFTQWRHEVLVMDPCKTDQQNKYYQQDCYFDTESFNALNIKICPDNSYEKLMWLYIHRDHLSINDIPLDTGDVLLSGADEKYIWLYTPMILYIIKRILEMP